MILKLLLFSILTTLVNAQDGVKNPVIIRNEDFKKGTTFNEALDQVYKKIVPRKSTKIPNECFWMLGDGQYIIATVSLPDGGMQIEPMLVKKIPKPEKGAAEYLINKTQGVSLEQLKENITVYISLAKPHNIAPTIMVERSEIELSEGLHLIKLIRKLGVKHFYIPAPVKLKQKRPEISLPKRRPVSPLSK